MATYYIDPTNGSNSNNGLGPDASHASNKPYATIAKIIGTSGVGVAGDVVYLAPGTYREVVTCNITSPASDIQFLGDPGNAQGFKTSGGVRVAAGDVIWTAFTTNDTSAPSASALLTLNGRDHLLFQFVVMVGGSAGNNVVDASTTHSTDITIRDCVLIPGAPNVTIIRYDNVADAAANWTIDRCSFPIGGSLAIRVGLATSGTADYDSNFVIQNCSFIGGWDTILSINSSGALANKGGGVKVYNSLLLSRGNAVAANGTNLSTSIPCTVYNCILSSPTQTALNSGASGQLVEDYNKMFAATARNNVSAGANSISTNAYPILLEFGQAAIMGRAARPYGTPIAGSPMLGFGNQAGGPSVDMLNRTRPSGGASTANAIGAFERHECWRQETSTVRTGANAYSCTGPGDHDFELEVDATSTTVAWYMRYDSSHAATNKPQMAVVNGGECGVNDATATMTAAADTWEQVSLTFTPARQGIVTIRLISRSAAAGGKAFADDLSIT